MARSTPAQRTELIESFRRSGMTQRKFASSRGVPVSRLQSWLYKRAPTRAAFVEIARHDEPGTRDGAVTLELADGVVCRFAALPPVEYVARLVEVLRAC